MSSNVTSGESKGVRYHGLDALRAWAMSMGIVLHAAWILIPADAGAPATDVSAHPFFEWMCLAIHTFRMQLFFVLAGFFACLLLRRRGIVGLVKNRLSRIVVPLIAFWLVLCPIMMWQYHAAGLQSGAIQSDRSAWSLTQEYFANITPDTTMLLHLWFLYYLSWAYLLVLAIRSAVVHFDRDEILRQLISKNFGAMMTRPWCVLLLAASFAPLVWVMKGPWGIEVGVDTLYPKWPGMLSYGLYFVVGWLLFRNVDKLDVMTRGWRWQLPLGLLLTIPYFYYAKAAMHHGYATLKYPELTVEDIAYDHTAGRADYPRFREALLESRSGTIANAVWNALPVLNREFVATHPVATDNQLTGLLKAINHAILRDRKFAQLSAAPDSQGLSSSLQPVSVEETTSDIMRTNRAIFEAGFPGIVLTEDVHRPYYHITRAAYAFTYSLTTWLLILGCIGCFQAMCSRESRFWRYFSDASYWMYLAHLPIQFQILIWCGDAPWSGMTKFAVYVLGTTAVLVPVYHFFVRPTWLGWLLNGKMAPVFRRNKIGPRDLVPADVAERERSGRRGAPVASATIM